jgi:hypothetical protein
MIRKSVQRFSEKVMRKLKADVAPLSSGSRSAGTWEVKGTWAASLALS